MTRPGAVVAIAATAVVTVVAAGCATTAAPPSPGPGASSSASSSTAPSATASARFVGDWHVHGETLTITPTTATRTASLGAGPCMQDPQVACSESDTLAVVSGNDTALTLRVTAVSYVLHSGQTTSSNPAAGPSTAVGDSMQLLWQAPGLLKRAVLNGFPGLQGGNPYWCGAGISQNDKQHCGA